MVGLVTQGAPLGLYKEEAASCRFTNVQSPDPGENRGGNPVGLRKHGTLIFQRDAGPLPGLTGSTPGTTIKEILNVADSA